MSLFANAKDRLMEQAALSYLNSKIIAPFGRATSLRIDSKAKTVSLELELEGESSPVSIELIDYEILNEAGSFFIKVRQARTSREWLTALAEAQLCGRKLPVPEQAGTWLSRML